MLRQTTVVRRHLSNVAADTTYLFSFQLLEAEMQPRFNLGFETAQAYHSKVKLEATFLRKNSAGCSPTEGS
jgi:hypothetical protein